MKFSRVLWIVFIVFVLMGSRQLAASLFLNVANLGLFATQAQSGEHVSSSTLKVVTQAEKSAPNHPAVHFALGRIDLINQNWEAAVLNMDHVASEGYNPEVANFWAGEASWRLGNAPTAKKYWDQAARENYRIAIWLDRNQQEGQALTGLTDGDNLAYQALTAQMAVAAIEAGAPYVKLYDIVGDYYLETGQTSEAINWFQRAYLHARPGHKDLMPAVSLARIYAAQGDYAVSRQWWLRAFERCPGECADFLYNVGTTYEREGEVAEALRYYQQALAIDPENGRYQEKVAQLRQQLEE